MPTAPIRFDAETAIGAALAALQKLDPETAAAIGNALTALANAPEGATLPGECVSVQRLCAATDWSKDRVYELLRDGELIGFSIGGRRFITTASVRGLIARRLADPTVIRYVKPPLQRECTPQPVPEPPRMDRRRKRRTEPIGEAA